jgi:hypothetical protein
MFEKEWEIFEDAVLPENAPEVQRTEMKKAFFSGALCVLVQVGMSSKGLSDEEGAEFIQSVYDEIKTELGL